MRQNTSPSVHPLTDSDTRNLLCASAVGLATGVTMILILMLTLTGHAQQPTDGVEPTPKVEDQIAQDVQEQTVMVQSVSSGIQAMKAFLEDEKLVKAGHAPKGWVQPDFEVYETELGLRPSMIPYDHYMLLVAAGHVSVDDGDRYVAWNLDQMVPGK